MSTPRKKLTREDFVRPFKPIIEEVRVPEIEAGGVIYARSFSAGDRSKLEVLGAKFKDKKNYDELPKANYLAFALGACLEDGTRLFGEHELDKVAELPSAVVGRVVEVIMRLNGMKKIEELEKNSESAQSGDSPSA